ncbi:PhnD/SsuA/transferrin family substrate-binding protein [Sedimentitalea todarodis]|uniref:PhnD/SsuA/transferrin family substrate-binding protein n=1 Tax=Sedimentitalea todarodis TaxID=1631240 RepID=A0ABU3VKH0_9RHOB|nr:PhnD/SsuA/transferrin family substrate-binding protein [Sedimentitalea todarodis]MDU9006687.1 PhnD/SsuA/transferrin family substrate-binding protein [Sedimentitalea todarodis]
MKHAFTILASGFRAVRISARRLTIAAALCGVFQATSATAEIALVFGTYAADKPTTTVRKYKPFLNYLALQMTEVLGKPVSITMKIARDYETGIDHLAEGQVDFARFGPASYITVRERNDGIQIVAMESKGGNKRFKGVIVVHSDSAIPSLSALSGQSFAFGDELSTIGRYLAQSHLIEAGITSHELSGYDFLGRHDRVGTAVGARRFTAGALKESTFNKLVASGVPIKVLFEFDNVTKPWLASSGLDPEILAAMRLVMLNTTDPGILDSINKDGFVEGTDADYDFIRAAMKHSAAF